MKLKLGGAEFDVETVDYQSRGGKTIWSMDFPYFIEPTEPLDIVCEEFKHYDWRIVCKYDCTQRLATFDNVNKDGRISIRPWFKIKGVNKKGKNTRRADERLLYRFTSDTNETNIGKTLLELDNRLGSYTFDVPFQQFLKTYTREKSFYIGLKVWWIMFKLKPPADYPDGVIVIAFPYRTQFMGAWTFDCKTGKRPEGLDGGDPHADTHVMRFPPGDTGREAVGKAIDAEIVSAKEQVARTKELIEDYKQRLEEEPESKRYKNWLKRAKKRLKKHEQKVKDRVADRAALKALE